MTKEEQQETAENLKMLREFGASLAMFREEQWKDINGLLLYMDDPLEVVAFFRYVMDWAVYSKMSPQELYSHFDPVVEARVRSVCDSLENSVKEEQDRLARAMAERPDDVDEETWRLFFGDLSET